MLDIHNNLWYAADMLRKFSETHIDKDLTETATDFENALLFNCKFRDLRGKSFINCDLNHSEFLTDRVEDLLNFSLTLNCHSFRNVVLSETIFDLLLLLLFITKGNDSKRKKLLSVVGADRARKLLRQLEDLE